MAADINSFISTFNNGFFRSNLYEINFTMPSLMTKKWPLSSVLRLSQLCASVDIPNATILESKTSYSNKTHSIAVGKDLDSITLTFTLDNELTPLAFIEDWINCIQDNSTFLLNYRSEYCAPEFNIIMFDMKENKIAQYKMLNVYPLNKDKVNLSYNDNNKLSAVSVNLSFEKYLCTFFKYPEEIITQAAVGLATDAIGKLPSIPKPNIPITPPSIAAISEIPVKSGYQTFKDSLSAMTSGLTSINGAANSALGARSTAESLNSTIRRGF